MKTKTKVKTSKFLIKENENERKSIENLTKKCKRRDLKIKELKSRIVEYEHNEEAYTKQLHAYEEVLEEVEDKLEDMYEMNFELSQEYTDLMRELICKGKFKIANWNNDDCITDEEEFKLKSNASLNIRNKKWTWLVRTDKCIVCGIEVRVHDWNDRPLCTKHYSTHYMRDYRARLEYEKENPVSKIDKIIDILKS